MCLHVVSRDPNKLKWKNGKLKVYKVMRQFGNNLKAVYRSFTYKRGLNIAKGRISAKDTISEGAFHVCLTLNAAKYHWEPDCVILQLTVNKKDFIALGLEEATFTKLYISQKMYRKAINSKSEKKPIKIKRSIK